MQTDIQAQIPPMHEINEHVRIRLENTNDLPSMPAVAVKILDLAQSPVSTMGQVADAVGYDPALATKLLKLANSPLYTQRRKCENIRQAVMALGLDSTLMITLSFSLMSSLRQQNTGLDYDRYWRRSLLASSAARLLAMQTEDINPEEAFLASLLQDIGMVVMDIMFEHFYEQNQSQCQTHQQQIAVERSKLSCDHADVGAWLLERWNFPSGVVNAVFNSHFLDSFDSPEELVSIDSCVALSGPIADALMAADRLQTQDDTDIPLHWLSDNFEPVLEDLCNELPIMEELFEISLMDSNYSAELTTRAKELLLIRGLNVSQELNSARKQVEVYQQRNERLTNEANLDHLTRVGNRKAFDAALEEEYFHARNHEWPLGLIFIDVNNFKGINDQYGHATGDKLLCHVATLVNEYTRDHDKVFRYAGDEFCVLLAGENQASTFKAACRIEQAISKSPVVLEQAEQVPIACSLGVACFDDNVQFKSHQQLFKAADQAMYAAKNSKEQNVVRWTPKLALQSNRTA